MPEGFEPTKNAFSTHIKELRGLVYQDSIPVVPDYSLLKEFNTRFSFLDEIIQTIHNSNTTPLVPENKILTLKGVKPGKKNISHDIINLNNFFIKYILGLLAKIGIRRWAPDLNDSDASLYNEACQISAIKTFCQLASGRAYKYMNVNLKFLHNLQLLQSTYDHIVYFTLAKQHKQEMKESGKYLGDKERQAILRARLRLKNLHYTFGVSQKFPRHYLKILESVDSNSDDECIPGSNKYHIKTLECQSNNSNEPLNSVCTRVPKGLPINFWDPSWFNSHSAGHNTLISYAFNIAFLPDASQFLRGIQHPNERLGDKKFTNKYWDQVLDHYYILHVIPNEEELDDSDEELDTKSEVESTNKESNGEEEVQ
ncbi:hypothetical protein O181_023656 [Austropuccinia psidii MF-1]|uniref:Uncharacterized protein n=1 Tax=Austropuccinia psidii MF-1 TaxID=1389203 RepID=A0A9Q3GXV7_9BASI|nr:hypothetical protein [Austropuccinia psidii MF-1]